MPMKRAFKSLFRKGEANVVKIICLSVGLAIGLVMLAEVIFERSYDDFIPRLKDTYQIQEAYKTAGSDWREYQQTPGAIAPGIKRYCPEVEAATRFTWMISDATFVTEAKQQIKGNAFLADSSFFEVFPRKILMGENPKTGLEKTGNAYISQTMLHTLGEGIMGKTLSWKDYPEFKITVAGVFEDFPENTHLPKMDILVALPTIVNIMGDGRNNWLGNDRYKSYIRLRPGTDIATVDKAIGQMIKENLPLDDLKRSGTEVVFKIFPVSKIFASSDYNRIMNIVFLFFAIIMLAVAVLNYILLVVSSMVSRAKSIATYRCYGARNSDIYRLVLSESSLHIIISLAVAILIIFSLQDFLQEQMAHSLKSLFPPATIVICLLVTLVVGLLCGLLPGYLHTRIPVTYAYRRYTESKRRWKLALLFVQFLLTTFFVGLLTVIGLEYNMLTNYKTGFEYKDILYTSLSGTTPEERTRTVEELKRLPNVKNVTWGYQFMADRCSGNNVFNRETEQEYMNIADMYYVGNDYHKTFDIPIIEGTTFITDWKDTLSQQIMVSRKFVSEMERLAGWKGSPIGKTTFLTEHNDGGKYPCIICGVYEDIHLGSQIAEDADERPTVMFYRSAPQKNLYIRMQQMGPDQLKEVQDVLSRTITSQERQAYSLDLEMSNLYQQLLHVRNSILFTGTCILIIALIGLIAYIRDEVARRRSEIAIRIIHGASVKDVEGIFLRDLLKIAVPAVVLGVLCAWRASDTLLQLFAAKIPLTWYLFAGCASVVLVVVVALASLLVLSAARANPTDNLKVE